MSMMTLPAGRDAFDFSAASLNASLEALDEARFGATLKTTVARAQSVLVEIATGFDEHEAIARRDMRPEAYARSMADARADAGLRIDAATSAVLDQLRQRIGSLSARLSAPPADVKDKAILVSEYRARLRLRDPLEVYAIYLEACRTRDAITIAAVETVPLWDRLVNDECLAAGRRIRAEVDAPDAVDALRETEQVLAALESAVRTCKRHCQTIDTPEFLTTVGENDE